MSVHPDAVKIDARTGIPRQQKSAETRTRCRVAGRLGSRHATTHAALDSSVTPSATIRKKSSARSPGYQLHQGRHHESPFSFLVARAWASIWRILISSPAFSPR